MNTIKLLKVTAIVLMIMLLAPACTESISKVVYIHNYESWIIKLKSEYKKYNDSDWSRIDEEFKQFSETEYNKYKDDFTEQERQKVDNITGQYFAIVVKYNAGKVKNEVKSILDKADGMINELQKK
jgi:hypothetical protein